MRVKHYIDIYVYTCYNFHLYSIYISGYNLNKQNTPTLTLNYTYMFCMLNNGAVPVSGGMFLVHRESSMKLNNIYAIIYIQCHYLRHLRLSIIRSQSLQHIKLTFVSVLIINIFTRRPELNVSVKLLR